ncbi:sensor domain-containing diguanylate cyclase [Methylobacillus gramineus]|uniref:sensor domain-containing diguanylate cyclase n=1 Tax=Methylobacillus gramineus TaxID=755169 RepID=UPI001CFF75E9|nr:sensor domain-containing diguanylate cyclase [Methylobacillus gramineus]MCB5183853.1 sensor domain-containing diguanylate cyclase [Methylobacillus gramineus]
MNRYKLILLITVILATGFLATSLVSYQVSRVSIHDSIVDSTLPLTSDNIYSEIQKDLVRPIFVSSMMASDTFLRDWIIDGETDIAKISKYLQEVQNHYGAFVSFLVSENTGNYYYGKGLLKQVNPKEERDAWYYRVRELKNPYEINVDRDMAHADVLTIFINYRVLDYQGQYLGAVGVGLTVDSVQKLISHYQLKFKRNVYFVDEQGAITLSGNFDQPLGSKIMHTSELQRLFQQAKANGTQTFEYEYDGMQQLINMRYIPELNWYLFVEQSESEATSDIRHALYINVLLCLVVTAIVVLLTHLALRRYQAELETMATTDSLTGLPNRKAFDIVIDIFLNESSRTRGALALIVLDIDHFKAINDRLGHFGGDHVLVVMARAIRACTRAADFICRWGGEEFLIVIKDCDEHSAMLLAEKIRNAVENELIAYKGEQISITASLGVAVARTGEKMEHVLDRADAAMYAAKMAGRNQVNLSRLEK